MHNHEDTMHDNDAADYTPCVARLATKITPLALGLDWIEGRAPADQVKALIRAAATLAKLAVQIKVAAAKADGVAS